MQKLPVIVEIDHEQGKVITIEDIEEALNYYFGAYSTVKVSAAEQSVQSDTCQFCEGTGDRPFALNEKCRYCGGTGTRR